MCLRMRARRGSAPGAEDCGRVSDCRGRRGGTHGKTDGGDAAEGEGGCDRALCSEVERDEEDVLARGSFALRSRVVHLVRLGGSRC